MNPLFRQIIVGAFVPRSFSVESLNGITIQSSEDDGNTVNAELQFQTSGAVRKRTETEVLTLFFTTLSPPTWYSKTPLNDKYVRIKFISGTDVHDAAGEALNTFIRVDNAERDWKWKILTGGPDTTSGVYSAEIADDSGGSTILAGPVNFTITLITNSP